ncbi:dienelactone hydrolase family protein [Stigmatella sp. ncwal1]|uniref:Dienelactone hydrolase family protein n=1 Tax=Stigmatella ashevillensis TaxID=2995309 RepID=A0ABT5DM40_9BACT|nr:dienelactone hydrolase family protein [Stigmatella ashevillena]MDC0713432.1 dienelactone hydrolase family protein [Stigmatella ashevillena]
MSIESRKLVYEGPGGPFEGVLAWDPGLPHRRPGILVAHSWHGQSEFEAQKAVALAELGYVGFAIDLYGQGRRGETPEQARKLMQELDSDRRVLQARMASALAFLRTFETVDPTRTGAIGFCLGGKCVLDLARMGAEVAGVVSFHGVFDPPPYPNADRIHAKVLIFHGWEDPHAPNEQAVGLANELTRSRVDWQLHAYGNTRHAFTVPGLNVPELGLAYQPDADRRSWQTMRDFFRELFG